jgi:hypothetical protein
MDMMGDLRATLSARALIQYQSRGYAAESGAWSSEDSGLLELVTDSQLELLGRASRDVELKFKHYIFTCQALVVCRVSETVSVRQ